jgi:hypothetical protein
LVCRPDVLKQADMVLGNDPKSDIKRESAVGFSKVFSGRSRTET